MNGTNERRVTRVVLMLCLTAAVAGCPPADQDGEPPPGKPAADASPVPAATAPMKPKFEIDADLDPDERVQPPAEPPLLRWDFSEQRTLAYAFSWEYATAAGAEETPDLPAGAPGRARGDMTLRIRSDGDGTATAATYDATAYVGGDERASQQQSGLVSTIGRLGEDGRIRPSGRGAESGQTAQADRSLAFLLPLPSQPLRPGESVEETLTLPSPEMLPSLRMTVRRRITLVGYVMRGGERCAQLAVDLSLAELDVPSDVRQGVEFVLNGRSVTVFGLESRSFVSGVLAMVTGARLNLPGGEGGGAPQAVELMRFDLRVELVRKSDAPAAD
ncbi:MAG: hypothetical protein R6V58_14640 [Planctomycetota bacterium]